MTLITFHDDPNFVAIEGFVLHTSRGNVYIEQADSVTLCRSEDGKLFFGSSGTVLEITNKTAYSDLLSRVRPATFRLVVEDDGEMSLVATIKEGKADPLDEIKLIGQPFSDVCGVDYIRAYEGVN